MPELSAGQQRQLAILLGLLESDDYAPTTVRAPQRAALVHVADSLAALAINAVRGAARIADLGSGAGFPGLPLAIALPAAQVSLIESQRRKCEFLQRACAAAQVTNAQVVCGRAEDWSAGAAVNQLVVARALAPQAAVLEYAAPLLELDGTLVDWRGIRDRPAEEAADRAAAMLGLRRETVRKVSPYEGANEHHLHVFVKAEPTPDRFPRRAGIARKRPLGS